MANVTISTTYWQSTWQTGTFAVVGGNSPSGVNLYIDDFVFQSSPAPAGAIPSNPPVPGAEVELIPTITTSDAGQSGNGVGKINDGTATDCYLSSGKYDSWVQLDAGLGVTATPTRCCGPPAGTSDPTRCSLALWTNSRWAFLSRGRAVPLARGRNSGCGRRTSTPSRRSSTHCASTRTIPVGRTATSASAPPSTSAPSVKSTCWCRTVAVCRGSPHGPACLLLLDG